MEPQDIAVVIPAFNAARTIRRSIASALAEQPAEVVVCDDGSTDSTPELAREAGAIVVTRANAGPAAARNTGIDLVVGRGREAVLLLDSDDELHPGALPAIARTARHLPGAALVLGGHVQVYPDGRTRERLPPGAWCSAGRLHAPALALGTEAVLCTTGLALLRPALAGGLRFDPGLVFGEDRDLVYRAGALGPIAIAARPLVRKHDEPGRLTANPALGVRWLEDQLRLVAKHAGDPAARAELARATAWVLGNTCRVLARGGGRLPASHWSRAADALASLDYPVPARARKWYWVGRLRSSLAGAGRRTAPASPPRFQRPV
ncbi:MAG TPA: glycosyltransferase family A protein [Phycisphaerales bacterium]|nr:glycosyltransferase family A protein [Phycisphaerales bacterium]